MLTMRTHRLQSGLLLLALLIGQWLSFAHHFQHPAALTEAPCALCVHAPGLDGGAPLASAVALVLPAPQTAVACMVNGILPLRTHAAHSIRGPPSTFV